MQRGQTDPAAEMVGRTVGNFRVTQILGVGGMGAVYRVEHLQLRKRAAIKILLPALSGHVALVERFFNEAQAVSSIEHPGVVEIYDFGHLADGSAYIVMELLDGESLASRLARLHRLPVDEIARLGAQIASTLAAAHARGIVHRDLKPDNLFVVPDSAVTGGERCKVLDFGIAKLTDETRESVKTRTGTIMGTPAYMAPEQCKGASNIDHRADIYALGCVLFHLACGRPPFVGREGAGEVMAAHIYEAAPPLRAFEPTIAPELEALVARMLSKSRDERPATMDEVADVLGRPGASANAVAPIAQTVLATPAPVPRSPSPTPARVAVPTTLGEASGASISAPNGGPRGRVAIAAAAVALAGVVAISLASSVGSDDAATPREVPIASAAPRDVAGAPAAAPRVERPPVSQPAVSRDAARPEPPANEGVAGGRIVSLLESFVRWADDHAGAGCPDGSDLGSLLEDSRDLVDPWGRPFVITCADQPAGQRIGVISAGPDGELRSEDDIHSWALGQQVTSIVAGSRWKASSHPGGSSGTRGRPKPSSSDKRDKSTEQSRPRDGQLDPSWGGQP